MTHAADHPTPATLSGPGWFDSTFELAKGLDVREGWPADAPLGAWVDALLRQSVGGAGSAEGRSLNAR